MQERRGHKRLDIDVFLNLKSVGVNVDLEKNVDIPVDVTDISRNGMGFISTVSLDLHSYYDAKLQIWTKEIIPVVIEIVRGEKQMDGSYKYGASFIGMMESDALKIDIYDMVHELT